MSYGIVRVQKFKSGSVKGIEIHDLRLKHEKSHTNKDIDWSKTNLNYNLHELEGSFMLNIKKRIDSLNLKKRVRKDAVYMVQCLVTSDKEFFKGLSLKEQAEFFKDSYRFLKGYWGEKNIISAIVHLDETTPHMHFNFVPVTKDSRLSAKSLTNKINLVKQQDDFFKVVGQKYGLKRGEKGGYKKHLEVAEYKKQTAFNELKSLENNIDDLNEKNNIVEKDLKAHLKALDEVNNIRTSLTNIDAINGKYGFLNKGKVTLDAKNFKTLKILAKKQYIWEQKAKELESLNKKLKNEGKHINSLKNEKYELQGKLHQANISINDLNEKLSLVTEFLQQTNQIENLNEFINNKINKVKEAHKDNDLDLEI